MKFLVAFVALVAVAAAVSVKPGSTASAELEAIIAAINSPSTDPATAALLEQQLFEIIAAASPISVGPAIVDNEPISVGPAIVEQPEYEPISVGPAVVDFPLPDGGAVTAEEPIVKPEAVVVPAAPAGSPLVQIILNINQAESTGVAPVAISPAPVAVGPAVIPAEPVQVVEQPIEPVQVVEQPIEPVQVIETAPIQVIEAAPVPVEPVIIGTPIIPSPAVVLPEELN